MKTSNIFAPQERMHFVHVTGVFINIWLLTEPLAGGQNRLR